MKYPEECVTLAKIIAPKLADVVARQRGKYYGFGTYEPEFPVFEQHPNIDKGLVNNIQMERQCGKIDNKLKKRQNLNAASRSEVLKGTQKL